MLAVPWYKEIISYIVPLTISKVSSEQHDTLKIIRYQGQWMLESKEALYSEGNSYKPFKLAFAAIEKNISKFSNFLLLGAGLCSAVKILHEKYGHYPSCDIVDFDAKILELNKEIPTLRSFDNLTFHCCLAEDYLDQNKKQYDLIGIDLFKDMEMAAVLLSNVFLIQLKKCSSANSCIIINTIFANKKEALAYEKQLGYYFNTERINYEPNYIYICKPLN
jgi:spermidine synthase